MFFFNYENNLIQIKFYKKTKQKKTLKLFMKLKQHLPLLYMDTKHSNSEPYVFTEKMFVTIQKTNSVDESYYKSMSYTQKCCMHNIHLEFYIVHTFLYLLAFYLFFSFTLHPFPLLCSSHPHLPSKLDPLLLCSHSKKNSPPTDIN